MLSVKHWGYPMQRCSPFYNALILCAKWFLSCCLTSTEARWPIRDRDRVGRGRESERLNRGNRPKKTGETVDRRQNNGSVKACPLAIAQRLVHCAIAVSTAVLDSVTKTMSVAPLLTAKWTGSHLLYPSVCAVSRMFIWSEQHGNVQNWVFLKQTRRHQYNK